MTTYMVTNTNVHVVDRTHNSPLWESRCPPFIHASKDYKIFLEEAAKGYGIIGLTRAEGGTLCPLESY
jgi:hypothetical protein